MDMSSDWSTTNMWSSFIISWSEPCINLIACSATGGWLSVCGAIQVVYMVMEDPGAVDDDVVVVVTGCRGGARSSRALTVPATWGSPCSSRMWRGRHNWLCGTPILRQASRKFSTFRRHLAMVSLGTAGEGTWMLGTDRGLTWLARWHSTTPSVRAAPRSLGNDTLRRASMFFLSCSTTSASSPTRGGAAGASSWLWGAAAVSPFLFSSFWLRRYRKLSGLTPAVRQEATPPEAG